MKYAALLLNAFAVLMLVWGLTGVASFTGARAPQLRLPAVELKPMADKDLLEQGDILKALQAIGRLDASPLPVRGASHPELVSQPAPGAPGSGGPLMPQRRVTLLVDGPDGYVAMIDGQLVRAGQRLSAGGKVTGFQGTQILVQEKNGRQTLSVPLDGLRVGTLRAPHAEAAFPAGQEPSLPLPVARSRQE